MVPMVRLAAGPSPKALAWLVVGVLVLHALLLGFAPPLEVRLTPSPPTGPVQVRVVRAAPEVRPAPRPVVRRPTPAPITPDTASPAAPVVESQSAAEPPVPTVPEPTPAAVASEPIPVPVAAPVPETTAALPLISLGALPTSRVLNYHLNGMDKGLNYHASGELKWQHNGADYELTLSVRAFLIGRRQWRSAGRIDSTGLAPLRFSDSWRNERAAHFDRSQHRVVFSSNSSPVPLESGAQDQISLYVQLAAAMAGEPERFVPGSRLQIQTVTVRDAQPWALVLEGVEAMTLDGQTVQATKWVCQPRNRFEAKVEFWVTPQQAWMPVRIRITQSSGSFIDLAWRGTEPLPPLPAQDNPKTDGTGS